MSVPKIEIDIGENEPSLDELVASIRRETSEEGAGAIVAFIGFVKGVVEGKRVEKLVYTTYDKYIRKIMYNLVRKVVEKYDNLRKVYVYHKIGELPPGDTTIYILVSAVDRNTGFNAAREVLETIKHHAPIFKLEVRDDGEFWVVGDKRIDRSSIKKRDSS